MQYSVLIKIAIDPQCGLHCSDQITTLGLVGVVS